MVDIGCRFVNRDREQLSLANEPSRMLINVIFIISNHYILKCTDGWYLQFTFKGRKEVKNDW